MFRRQRQPLAFAILALAACGPTGGGADAGSQGPEAFRPPPFSLHPRSRCRMAGAFFVGGSDRDVVAGVPSPAVPEGYECVETGHPGAQPGVVYSDVDNPRIWTGVDLVPIPQPTGGTLYPAWSRTTSEVLGSGVDLMGAVSGGEGGPPPDGLSGNLAAIAQPVTPWSASVGPFSSLDGTGAFAPYLGGLRAGKTALRVGLEDSGQSISSPANVALDPAVMLVPVQVVVFYADAANPPSLASLKTELALWDRLAVAGTPYSDPWAPDSHHRPLEYSVAGGEAGPWEAQFAGFNLPDDVWAACGVQFRLVNFVPLVVGPQYTKPQGHGTLSGTLADFWDHLQQEPRVIKQGVVTVLFAPLCSDYDAAEPGQIEPPAGQSLIGHYFSCARPKASNVLAHELGHVIMQTTQHEDCPTNPPSPLDRNLMCPNAAAGVGLKAYTQCAAARKALAASGLLHWFPGQQ